MANKIDVALWELTKEEAAHLPDGTQVLIYNPLTDDYKIERIGKGCLARSKYAASQLKYFSFEDIENKDKEKENAN